MVTVSAVASRYHGVLADFVFPVSWPSGVTSIYSFKKYLSRACSEPATVLDARATVVYKTDRVPGIVCKNICDFLSLHLGPCKLMLQVLPTESIFLSLASGLASGTVTNVIHSEA